MKIPVLIVCCLVVGVTYAESAKREMWAWKDANGVTQYSDRPVPGARRIEIATLAPENIPEAAPSVSGVPSAPKASVTQYSLLEIWSPQQDESFFGGDAQVEVRVRSEPEVAPKHHLRVYLDGKLIDASEPNAAERTFSNLDRGAHSLQAHILDDQGNELIRSETRVFHIRQPTVEAPPNVGPNLKPKPTPHPVTKPPSAPKAPAGA